MLGVLAPRPRSRASPGPRGSKAAVPRGALAPCRRQRGRPRSPCPPTQGPAPDGPAPPPEGVPLMAPAPRQPAPLLLTLDGPQPRPGRFPGSTRQGLMGRSRTGPEDAAHGVAVVCLCRTTFREGPGCCPDAGVVALFGSPPPPPPSLTGRALRPAVWRALHGAGGATDDAARVPHVACPIVFFRGRPFLPHIALTAADAAVGGRVGRSRARRWQLSRARPAVSYTSAIL